jgi:hypothetical protein
MDNKDMPAMPQSGDNIEQWNDPRNPKAGTYFATGLTKREHFAGLAMQGLCHAIDSQGTWAHDPKTVAESAVTYADALLAELDKVKQ